MTHEVDILVDFNAVDAEFHTLAVIEDAQVPSRIVAGERVLVGDEGDTTCWATVLRVEGNGLVVLELDPPEQSEPDGGLMTNSHTSINDLAPVG